MNRTKPLHSWGLTTAQARDVQLELAGRVDARRPLPAYETVAGADASYNKFSPRLHAAVVVLRADTWEVVDRAGVTIETRFPYVPGLLSFREVPAVLAAFEKLTVRPDVVICDGQGLAHPRRFGLACHLGIWLDVPTVGCAKSRLVGEHEAPGPERGARAALTHNGEMIGAVVRSRAGVKPLYVSVGHLCNLDDAVALVLAATPKYRQPVTTRAAHKYVNELRLGDGER